MQEVNDLEKLSIVDFFFFFFFFSSSLFSLEFSISLGGRANMILLLLGVYIVQISTIAKSTKVRFTLIVT